MKRRYDIRRPPAASGTSVFSTGRNGAATTMRLPPRLTARSAIAQRDSPIQAPIRPRRIRAPKKRPARKVSDQPPRHPTTTLVTTTTPPLAGPRASTTAISATSAGTSMPTSGIVSNTMTTPSDAMRSSAGSSPIRASQSAMP